MNSRLGFHSTNIKLAILEPSRDVLNLKLKRQWMEVELISNLMAIKVDNTIP